MSTTPRRLSLLAPLLLAGVALSGCGVADDPVRPGLAAQVDGTGVDRSELDDTVEGTCAYLDEATDGPTLPRVTVRRLLVETLVREVAADKLLGELDLPVPATYQGAVAQIDASYDGLPADQSDAMRAGDTASTFVALASDAIGASILGVEVDPAGSNAQEVRDAGTAALDDWLAEHDVELNPAFGLRYEDGAFVADDGLSVPASTEAVFAQGVADIDLDSEDQQALGAAISDATAALPADQVCGPTTEG